MVRPLGSVGSIVMSPMALVAKLPEMKVQLGVLSRALFVLQIPPPAAPTYKRQCPSPQWCSIAKAEMRPEATYGAAVRLRISGYRAMLGPIEVHGASTV